MAEEDNILFPEFDVDTTFDQTGVAYRPSNLNPMELDWGASFGNYVDDTLIGGKGLIDFIFPSVELPPEFKYKPEELTEEWDMGGTDQFGLPNMMGYEEYEDEFKHVKYAIEAKETKDFIDAQLYRKRKMADAPLSAGFAAGVFDPVNLVAISTTGGVGLLSQVLINARRVGLASIPLEAGRQYIDPTADWRESTSRVGMNMAFSVPFTLAIRGGRYVAGKIQNKNYDVDPNNVIVKDFENQYDVMGDYPTLNQAKNGEDFAFVFNTSTENIPKLKTAHGNIKDTNGYAEYNSKTQTVTVSPKLQHDFQNRRPLFPGHPDSLPLPKFRSIREATEFYKMKAIVMKTNRYPAKKGEAGFEYNNRINNAILNENQKILNVNFDPSVVDDATVKMIAKLSNQFAPVGRVLNTKFKNKEVNAEVKIFTQQTFGDKSISYNAMLQDVPFAISKREINSLKIQDFTIVHKNFDNLMYMQYRSPDYLTNTSEPLKQAQLTWNTKGFEYLDKFKKFANVKSFLNKSKVVEKGEEVLSNMKGTRRTEADTKAFINQTTNKPYTQDEYMSLVYEHVLTGQNKSALPNSVKDHVKFYQTVYADFRKELLETGELISEAGLKKDIAHYQAVLSEMNTVTKKIKTKKDKLGIAIKTEHMKAVTDIQYIIRSNQNMLKEFELGIRNELDVNPNYVPIAYLPDQIRLQEDKFINKLVKELTKQRATGKPVLAKEWRTLEKQGKPMTKNLSTNEKDIREAAGKIYRNIVRDADANNTENAVGFRNMANGERRSIMGAAQSRNDIIPQEWLMENGFLNTNISDLTQRYVQTAFKRMGYKERLGDAFGIAERFRIQTRMLEKEVTTPKDLIKVKSVMSDLTSEMEKDYHVFFVGDPTSFTVRTAKLAKDTMGTAYMGKAAAASMPDVGKLILSNGFLPTWRAMLSHNPVSSRATHKGAIGKTESYNDLQAMINDPAIIKAITERPNLAEAAMYATHDAFGSASRYMDTTNAVGVNAKAYTDIGQQGPTLLQKMGQGMDATGKFMHTAHKDYYLANMLTSWTNWMKNLNNIAGMDDMIRAGIRISKNQGSVTDQKIWKSMLLNKRDADFIKKMVDKKEIEEANGLMFAQRNNWMKYEYGDVASHKFANALYSHTERSIVSSSMTDKPNLAFGVIKFKGKNSKKVVDKLFNNAVGKALGFSQKGNDWRMDNALVGLITQFMTHPIASQRKTVGSSLSGRERNVVGGFTNMIMFGILSQWIKNPSYFARLDAEEQLLRGIEASGAFALWGDANFYVETLSMNKLGIRPLAGLPPKYGETDEIDALGMGLGAAPGAFFDQIRSLTSDTYSEGKRTFVRNLPFANYPVLGRLLKDGLYANLYDALRLD